MQSDGRARLAAKPQAVITTPELRPSTQESKDDADLRSEEIILCAVGAGHRRRLRQTGRVPTDGICGVGMSEQ